MLKQSDSKTGFAEQYRANPLRALCVSREATIRETLAVIDSGAKEIALVVDGEGVLIGTVTDGDIRRGMLRGLELDSPVVGVLCADPVSLPQGASPMRVLRLMVERSINQLPLLDSAGRPISLRTISELIRFEQTLTRHGVIIAGGRGKRLAPLTDRVPKPMLQVGKRPICETIVREMVGHGITRITIALGYMADAIRDHFGDGERFGAEIDYVHEKSPLGTAGALGLLAERPAEAFLVTNADLLTNVHYANLFSFHQQENVSATICVRKYAFDVPYGVAEIEGSRLKRINEKPRQTFFVNAGIYVLDPETLELIQPGEKLDMPTLIARIEKVGAFPIREYWLDIGNPDDFARAEAEYSQHFKQD